MKDGKSRKGCAERRTPLDERAAVDAEKTRVANFVPFIVTVNELVNL